MLSPNQTRFNLGRGWLSHPTVPRIPNGYRWSPISPLSPSIESSSYNDSIALCNVIQLYGYTSMFSRILAVTHTVIRLYDSYRRITCITSVA